MVTNYLNKILKTAALAAAGIPAGIALYSLSALANATSEKIDSDEKLQRIVKEESEKLGITDSVKGELHEDYQESMSYHKASKTYTVHAGGRAAKRAAVKHELAHLKKNHCHGMPDESVDTLFNYIFIEEPQAILYSLGVIK